MVKIHAVLTVTGKGKRECQDAVKVERIKGTSAVVFALADGAGSAPYGKEGAEFLVNNFVKTTKEQFLSFNLSRRVSFLELPLLRKIETSLREVRGNLIEMSISREIHPESFHSTFIGGLILQDHFGKSILVYVSIGDSVIVVLDDELNVAHTNAITLAEYPNTTVFVTSPEFENVITGGIVRDPKVVFISSDGMDNIFFSEKFTAEAKDEKDSLPYYDKFLWEVEPFSNLSRFVKKICSGEMNEEKLKAFLSMDKVFEYNGDDKSLILFEVKDEPNNESRKDNETAKLFSRGVEQEEEEADTPDHQWIDLRT